MSCLPIHENGRQEELLIIAKQKAKIRIRLKAYDHKALDQSFAAKMRRHY